MSFKLFDRLRQIESFEAHCHCRNIPPRFEGRKGSGQVVVSKQSPDSLVFFEKGKWVFVHSKTEIAFTNILRWTVKGDGEIDLEHLRYGHDNPIFLFSLSQVNQNLFKSLKPFECKEDTYMGSVLFDQHYIHLNWQITGPKKRENLTMIYMNQ